MNDIKIFAKQLQMIAHKIKEGKISPEHGAIRLQSLAAQIDEAAKDERNQQYSTKIIEISDMIRDAMVKLAPEKRVVQ